MKKKSVEDRVEANLGEVGIALGRVDPVAIHRAALRLRIAKNQGGTVWIVGNGGSAATAMHFANDLVKMCGINARAIPAEIPTMTAYGNDNGWEEMFASPIAMTKGPEDILVAITCSGNSKNVIACLDHFPPNRKAPAIGPGPFLHIPQNWIGLTGYAPRENSLLLQASDRGSMGIVIPVKHADIKVVESVHSAICHTLIDAYFWVASELNPESRP